METSSITKVSEDNGTYTTTLTVELEFKARAPASASEFIQRYIRFLERMYKHSKKVSVRVTSNTTRIT